MGRLDMLFLFGLLVVMSLTLRVDGQMIDVNITDVSMDDLQQQDIKVGHCLRYDFEYTVSMKYTRNPGGWKAVTVAIYAEVKDNQGNYQKHRSLQRLDSDDGPTTLTLYVSLPEACICYSGEALKVVAFARVTRRRTVLAEQYADDLHGNISAEIDRTDAYCKSPDEPTCYVHKHTQLRCANAGFEAMTLLLTASNTVTVNNPESVDTCVRMKTRVSDGCGQYAKCAKNVHVPSDCRVTRLIDCTARTTYFDPPEELTLRGSWWGKSHKFALWFDSYCERRRLTIDPTNVDKK